MTFFWSPRSLQGQLNLATVVVLLALGGAIVAAAHWQFATFQDRLTQARNERAIEQLLAAIQSGTDGPYLDTNRLDPAFNRPLSGHYYLIRAKDKIWRSRSLWDLDMLSGDMNIDTLTTFASGPGDQVLRIMGRRYQRYGETFEVIIASNYSDLIHEFHQTLTRFYQLWAAALVITLILLNTWMYRALRPLEHLRGELVQIQRGQLRALQDNGPEELRPLLQQLNTLLTSARESLSRSRNALGNLGHTLKTPLAAMAVLAQRPELQQHCPELQQQLSDQLQQVTQRVNRELARNHIATASTYLEPFAPASDLPPLIDTLHKVHGRQLNVIIPDSGQLILPQDKGDMIEMLGNLLDNAYKWAKQRISVSIENDEGWVLRVDDDGPGITEAANPLQALARGQRLDETGDGQGLGLAIVSDIVNSYGGQIRLGQSDLGGLSVTIYLPNTG